MPPERDLQFKNSSSINASTVTDDDENGRTIVTLPTVPTIINHLRSTDQDAVLSAKQGNVLANDLASYVLSDTKPSTQIDAGKFFVDKDGILRVATANIGTTTDVDNTNSTVKSIGEVLTELNSKIPIAIQIGYSTIGWADALSKAKFNSSYVAAFLSDVAPGLPQGLTVNTGYTDWQYACCIKTCTSWQSSSWWSVWIFDYAGAEIRAVRKDSNYYVNIQRININM